VTRILAVLLLLAGLGGALAWVAPPRADLAEFLPPGETPATRFLFRELQSGAATTLLLAAIEGRATRRTRPPVPRNRRRAAGVAEIRLRR
jgi:hypothetical protein